MFALSLTLLKYTFSEMKLNFATRNQHIPIHIKQAWYSLDCYDMKYNHMTGDSYMYQYVVDHMTCDSYMYLYVVDHSLVKTGLKCTQVWFTALSHWSCGIKRVKEKIISGFYRQLIFLSLCKHIDKLYFISNVGI